RESTLLRSDRFVANAVISGDGHRVTYSTGSGDIFGIAVSGGAAESLCSHCGTVMGASRDGSGVLYEPLQNEDLMLWNGETRTGLKLASRLPGESVLSGGRYSPDGRWVAFHEIDNKTSTARVWIAQVNLATPTTRENWTSITEGGSVERDPAWSPDGHVLYFLSERDGVR